ncbi:MAG: hypothetical protein AAF529_02460 [Pseudomonadota bacterium]
MNRRCVGLLILSLLVPLVGVQITLTSAPALAAPGSTASSARQGRLSTAPRAVRYLSKPTRKHVRLVRSKMQLVQATSDLRRLNAELTAARRSENRIRERHAGNDSSRLRNQVRQATLTRANLEMARDRAADVVAQRTQQYRADRAQLRGERRGAWQRSRQQANASKAQTAAKARKITISNTPLGPTGSGQVRPSKSAPGVLRTSSRYASALEKRGDMARAQRGYR